MSQFYKVKKEKNYSEAIFVKLTLADNFLELKKDTNSQIQESQWNPERTQEICTGVHHKEIAEYQRWGQNQKKQPERIGMTRRSMTDFSTLTWKARSKWNNNFNVLTENSINLEVSTQ